MCTDWCLIVHRRVVGHTLVGGTTAQQQAAARAAGTHAQLQAAAAAEGAELLERILPDSAVDLLHLLTMQLHAEGWGVAQELMLLAADTAVRCCAVSGKRI